MTAALPGDNRGHVVIVGAGFTGLAAAYDLAKQGICVTVVEEDTVVGGLAGSFDVNGTPLEKFYHHWFTNDRHVHDLVKELGTEDQIVYRSTRTGSYFSNRIFRLSRPADLLRYTPLSMTGRIRMGALVFQARAVRDWRKLEDRTARDWLLAQCGREVYDTVWEPLLRGKFGSYAEEISAVWFWNKMKLRGGSRGRGGGEQLAYYKGGFAALSQRLAGAISTHGGRILTDRKVTGLLTRRGRAVGVTTAQGDIEGDAVLVTTALPIFTAIAADHLPKDYVADLGRIAYLGNVCLTLELDRSLSSTYWLNVVDPGFPFVGVIEHTNFEPKEAYGERHIVYLSKYLETENPLYRMEAREFFDYAEPYLKRMFPAFEESWVKGLHLYRAAYSQPIVTRNYSKLIPDEETPLPGLYLATMAQIYPEDRGTNYAIRGGKAVAARIAKSFGDGFRQGQ